MNVFFNCTTHLENKVCIFPTKQNNLFLDYGEFNQTFIELESSIKNECKKLGINFLIHFGIREFYSDGTTVGFCTNEDWNKIVNSSLINLEMERHYFEELLNVKNKNVKYILRTKDRANNSFLKHLVDLDMATSLILYRPELDIIKGYYFMIHHLDSDAISFFINNLSIFEKLIDKINPILYKNIHLQNTLKNRISLFSLNQTSKIFGIIDKKITQAKYQVVFQGREYTFTPQEMKILEMIGYNCTSKEIGKELNASYRTIEWHLKNIKEKIGIFSKMELIDFIRKTKIIQ